METRSWSIKRQAYVGLNAGASVDHNLETGVVTVVAFVMKWRGRKSLHASQPKISRRHQRFPREIPFVSPSSEQCSWLAEANSFRRATNQKYYPNPGNSKSSVWNVYARSSDDISRECWLFSQFFFQAYLLRLSPLLRPPNFHST